MEKRMILAFFVLVALFALTLAIPQELYSSVRGNTTDKSIVWEAMAFSREPTASVDYSLMPGDMHSYTIDIPLEITYSGKLTADAAVIAIVEYKDRDARAIVMSDDTTLYWPNGEYKDIRISNNRDDQNYKKFDGFVQAKIQTGIPPIDTHNPGNYYKEGWKVKTVGDKYLVGVFKMSRSVMSYITTPLKPCTVQFVIETEKTPKYQTLKKGEEEKLIFETGTLTIKVEDTKSGCNEVKFTLRQGDGEQWEITENILISFWKWSDCTRNHATFEDLKNHCVFPTNNDFLGRKIIKVPVDDII